MKKNIILIVLTIAALGILLSNKVLCGNKFKSNFIPLSTKTNYIPINKIHSKPPSTTLDQLQGTWISNTDNTGNSQIVFTGIDIEWSRNEGDDPDGIDEYQAYLSDIPYDYDNPNDISMFDPSITTGQYLLAVEKGSSLSKHDILCFKIWIGNNGGVGNLPNLCLSITNAVMRGTGGGTDYCFHRANSGFVYPN